MVEYKADIERLHTRSQSPVDERIAGLRTLFPEAVREGKIDFEALQRALGEWVEPSKERFGLSWPGKAECMRLIQQPSVGTLVPDRAGSVEFDTTGNLIIEGDNLEVLKLLQKSYHGQVKMIYIDPPYNTGNDFVYRDDYKDSLANYRLLTGTTDASGARLSTNAESAGRYHSNWLSMIYPRLYLARELLRADGAICVSIDSNEGHDLRLIMNEIFGEENFVGELAVIRAEGGGLAKQIVQGHDYLLIYARQITEFEPLRRPKDIRGKVIERDGVEYWLEEDWLRAEFGKYGTLRYEEIEAVKGVAKKREIDDGLRDGRYQLLKKEDGGHIVLRLRRLDEDGSKFYSVVKHLSADGKRDLEALGLAGKFSFPKPVSLIQSLVLGATFSSRRDQEIVLDFFAGSGTTAHAVMKQNAEDGGNRKYILVQLPEPLDPPKRLDDGTELRTIADICRERVRRAGRQIANEQAGKLDLDGNGGLDTGFRSYRLAASNFAPWNGDAAQIASVERQIELFTENVVADRSPEDLLTEILLKAGYPLTTPVEWLELAGNRVASVAEGALLVCLDQSISLEAVEAMAALDPGQIVCLEAGFEGDDVRKVNAWQLIRSRARDTESAITFKVV